MSQPGEIPESQVDLSRLPCSSLKLETYDKPQKEWVIGDNKYSAVAATVENETQNTLKLTGMLWSNVNAAKCLLSKITDVKPLEIPTDLMDLVTWRDLRPWILEVAVDKDFATVNLDAITLRNLSSYLNPQPRRAPIVPTLPIPPASTNPLASGNPLASTPTPPVSTPTLPAPALNPLASVSNPLATPSPPTSALSPPSAPAGPLFGPPRPPEQRVTPRPLLSQPAASRIPFRPPVRPTIPRFFPQPVAREAAQPGGQALQAAAAQAQAQAARVQIQAQRLQGIPGNEILQTPQIPAPVWAGQDVDPRFWRALRLLEAEKRAETYTRNLLQIQGVNRTGVWVVEDALRTPGIASERSIRNLPTWFMFRFGNLVQNEDPPNYQVSRVITAPQQLPRFERLIPG